MMKVSKQIIAIKSIMFNTNTDASLSGLMPYVMCKLNNGSSGCDNFNDVYIIHILLLAGTIKYDIHALHTCTCIRYFNLTCTLCVVMCRLGHHSLFIGREYLVSIKSRISPCNQST